MTGSTVLPNIKMTWFKGVDYTIIHQFLKSSKVHVLSMFKLGFATSPGYGHTDRLCYYNSKTKQKS